MTSAGTRLASAAGVAATTLAVVARSIPFAVSRREIADAVGCSVDTAIRRLDELEDEGSVERREVGNAFLWMLAEA